VLVRIFNQVLNMSLAASIVAILLMLIRFVFRNRLPKTFSYALWSIVLVRLLIPVYFAAVFSIFNVLPVPETTKISGGMQNIGIIRYVPDNIDTESVKESIQIYNGAITETSHHKTEVINSLDTYTSGENSEAKDYKQGFMFIAAVIWAFGLMSLLASSIIMYIRTVRRLQTAILYKDNNILEETSKMLKLRRKVRIFYSDEINSPIVCGFFKPRILLPLSLVKDNNLFDLKHIITHELIHIKRLDYFFKPLSVIVACIHWFNPVIWLSFILFQKDMEMSCDERVLAVYDKDIRSDYATSLINLSAKQNSYLNAGLLAFGEGGIKSRIKGIMNYKKSGFWMAALSALVIIVLGVVLLTNPYGGNDGDRLAENNGNTPVKTNENKKSGMEIYLVAGSNQKYTGEVEDLNSLVLENEPLISKDDIVSYNWDDHSLKIKNNKKISNELLQRSFVVVSDGEKIYQGAFWSAIYSMIPPKIAIYLDNLTEENGFLFLSLGSWRIGGEIQPDVADILSDLHLKETLNRDGQLFKPYLPKNFPVPDSISVSGKEAKYGYSYLDWEKQDELIKSLDARFVNDLDYADYKFIPEEDNKMREEETIITLHYNENIRGFKYNIDGKETEIIFNEIMMPVTGEHDDLVYFRGYDDYEEYDYEYKHGFIGYVSAPIGKLEKFKGVEKLLENYHEEEYSSAKEPEKNFISCINKKNLSGYYEFSNEEVERIKKAQSLSKRMKSSKEPSEYRFINLYFKLDGGIEDWYYVCDDRQTFLSNGQYINNPVLSELILGIAKEKLGFEIFDTSVFKDLVKAKYSFRTNTRTYDSIIEDKSILKEIEEELQKARQSRPGKSPHDGVLTLTFSDGTNMDIRMASDDCPGLLVNGNYFEYSNELHEIFVNNFDNFPYV